MDINMPIMDGIDATREIVTAFIVTVLSQPIDWPGHFTVAREGSLRVVPLP